MEDYKAETKERNGSRDVSDLFYTTTTCVIIVHCLIIRYALASLHFNENAGRKQAITKKGEECFDM